MKTGTYFKTLEWFLMNDQPFTCPHCGARCQELANFSHTRSKSFIQQCQDVACGFIGVEEADEHYLTLWGTRSAQV